MEVSKSQSPTDPSRKEPNENKKLMKVTFTVENETYKLDVGLPAYYWRYNLYVDVPRTKREEIFQTCAKEHLECKRLHQEAEELLIKCLKKIENRETPSSDLNQLLKDIKAQYILTYVFPNSCLDHLCLFQALPQWCILFRE